MREKAFFEAINTSSAELFLPIKVIKLDKSLLN